MPVEFTPVQLEAVEYRAEDACILAGPGSGKTTVLVERYRRLIHEHGFEPRQILAITFTEKAAANMKTKIADTFRHDPRILRDLENGAWISTIHGFCARLLRENAVVAGIDPQFRVPDEWESEGLQFECVNDALDELVKNRRDQALALIAALYSPDVAGDLRYAYDAIRSAGLTAEEIRRRPAPIGEPGEAELRAEFRDLLRWSGRLTDVQRLHRAELLEWTDGFTLRFGERTPVNAQRIPAPYKEGLKALRGRFEARVNDLHAAPFRELILDVLARFEELYRDRKTERGWLDFNDLERRAIELLRDRGEVRDRLRAQFRQVMLDEFQDINEQQWFLMNHLRGKDVFFGVGDINQSIYGFRHARPAIFNRWREEIIASGKHSASLLDNFRSRQEILRGVEAVLNNVDGIQTRELVARTQFDPKAEPPVEVRAVVDDDEEERPKIEARWIAHRILELHARHDFRDFAILCRNGNSMPPIFEALEHAGIPYVCGRRQSFLLSRDARDLTALLQVIANPRDGIALATVLRSPVAGVSDEGLLRLRLIASSITSGLNLCAREPQRLEEFDPGDRAALRRFAFNLERWRAEQPVLPLDLLLVRALDDSGFTGSDDAESFIEVARTRGNHNRLLSFLQDLEKMRTALSPDSDLADRDQGDRVQVMTAHAAKGLEFPVVIIAAMDKGTRTTQSAMTFTPEHGLGVRWRNPEGKAADDSWQAANSKILSQREKEEANRLLYVAMTRAQDHLILSYSRGESKRPGGWVKIIEKLPNIQPFQTGADPPNPGRQTPDARTEIATVARIAVADQHDSAVSATSLAVFSDCPRRYYIGRYLGWRTQRAGRRTSAAPAAELGVMVHDILAGKPGDYPAEARELASVFLDSDLGRRASHARRSEREWEFIAEIDETIVRGTIDLWFEDESEITIVDYKTDAEVRPESYFTQIRLYALALERAIGHRPSRAWLHFLRANALVEVSLNGDASAVIGRWKQAHNSLTFDMNLGDHCRSCPFFHGFCPAEEGAPMAY